MLRLESIFLFYIIDLILPSFYGKVRLQFLLIINILRIRGIDKIDQIADIRLSVGNLLAFLNLKGKALIIVLAVIDQAIKEDTEVANDCQFYQDR